MLFDRNIKQMLNNTSLWTDAQPSHDYLGQVVELSLVPESGATLFSKLCVS